VYPMQLVMSDGNLVVRITTSQTIEHYTRNLIVIVVLLAVSAVLFPFVNNGRGFVIALAVCLPIMTCMLFAFQYLDTPYRNAKRLQKYIDK
jgi:purine-cytosine permease-like protein